MDITEIITYLEDNGLEEVEEIKNVGDAIIIKFYYDFDNDELSAARSYSNDESDFEEESDEWYKEYFIPYLYDYGNDEVVDIIEEIVEELDIAGEVMAFQINSSSFEFIQFMALFTEEDTEITIEDVAKEYIC